MSAPTPDARDIELLGQCVEFHTIHADLEALPRETGDDEVAAALAERWNVADQIAAIPAMTDAGRRAKAEVASVLLDEWGSRETSRTVIFVRAVLRDIGGRAAT